MKWLFIAIPVAVVAALVVVIVVVEEPQEICFRSEVGGVIIIEGAKTVTLSEEPVEIMLDTGSNTFVFNSAEGATQMGHIRVYDAHVPEVDPEYDDEPLFEADFCSIME